MFILFVSAPWLYCETKSRHCCHSWTQNQRLSSIPRLSRTCIALRLKRCVLKLHIETAMLQCYRIQLRIPAHPRSTTTSGIFVAWRRSQSRGGPVLFGQKSAEEVEGSYNPQNFFVHRHYVDANNKSVFPYLSLTLFHSLINDFFQHNFHARTGFSIQKWPIIVLLSPSTAVGVHGVFWRLYS